MVLTWVLRKVKMSSQSTKVFRRLQPVGAADLGVHCECQLVRAGAAPDVQGGRTEKVRAQDGGIVPHGDDVAFDIDRAAQRVLAARVVRGPNQTIDRAGNVSVLTHRDELPVGELHILNIVPFKRKLGIGGPVPVETVGRHGQATRLPGGHKPPVAVGDPLQKTARARAIPTPHQTIN